MNDWFGSTVETPGTPMVDSATGRPLILRTYTYFVKPNAVGNPTKQQIFNYHWPQIKTMIWADGLVANTDIDPRVVVGKKKYRIFVLCEPRFRQMVVDRPTTLQDVFKKKLTK